MQRFCTFLLLLLPVALAAQSSDELLGDANVHDIYLEMSPDDWQSLRDNYLLDTKYAATFVWNTTRLERVTVRSRGSGSRNALKPSLKIDFDGVVKDQTLDGLKSVVLDNNIQDLSMIRERVVMKAMRALGVPAPRESSARVFVNGEFSGIFTVVEPLDKVYLTKQFGENGGTLYEYNVVEPFFFQDLGADPALYIPAMFEPKTNESDPKGEELVRFIQMLNYATDSEFPQELARLVDLDQFLLFVASQQYLAEVDGFNGWNGTNNFYLYQSGGRFTFIAWDMDLSFYHSQLSVLYKFDLNVITRRIWQDPKLRNMYLNAVRRVADFCGGPNGWLDSEITWASGQVSQGVLGDPSNACLGEDGMPLPCDGQTPFDAETQALLVFGRQRYGNVIQELIAVEGSSTDPSKRR